VIHMFLVCLHFSSSHGVMSVESGGLLEGKDRATL
jgi:hypothetical protein